jgi:hypothetical protein
MTRPYVSFAFVNRNDGYGGDLEQRIAKFIDYYAHYARKWPGLFEFVICDWNPPAERPRLRDAFRWQDLGDVLHVEVPHEVHLGISGPQGRKMQDYIGRNVAIRQGRGEFSLVLNQDIFVSDSILQLIARRALSDRHFYRADRCDFDFEPCRNTPAAEFEQAALDTVFAVHRRHGSNGQPISVQVGKEGLRTAGSQAEPGDRIEAATGVMLCRAATRAIAADRRWDARWQRSPWSRPLLRWWRKAYLLDTYHRKFYLHTNASGDFILAPRKAFDDIQGMNETTQFYMHLDGYAIVQLFSAGYEQAIFAQPHRVYHADHDRSARAGFQETISWAEHEAVLSAIARGERPYRLNGADWGLAGRNLPAWRVATHVV